MVPFFRRRLLIVAALCLVALLTGCGNRDSSQVAAPKPVDDRFAIEVGGRPVQMQLALHPAEMQQGLMYRKSMGAEEGMLFAYDRPQQMSFWMRNTELPLDIGFFDASGELREIYPLYPHDERPVQSLGPRQFALEMNQGWFARAGVKPGAKLDRAALAGAIRARGSNPATFGLP
ncbi:MAG TPA: DUF192 domain-containing protein [Lacunisphaera sp.]|nr:DUF192 domain-containing protein [Lacunisphaera sp.]